MAQHAAEKAQHAAEKMAKLVPSGIPGLGGLPNVDGAPALIQSPLLIVYHLFEDPAYFDDWGVKGCASLLLRKRSHLPLFSLSSTVPDVADAAHHRSPPGTRSEWRRTSSPG